MGRKNRSTADQSWSEDTGELTAAEYPSPQVPQSAAKQAATPETAEGFMPLDSFPAATEMFGADRLARIAWAFIALGIVIRTIRFLLDFPLWPDEAYLAHNYLDRGYLDLLQGLDYVQIAPLLYLWVQKTVLTICGFSESSLRLFAFIGSIASLFVFRHLSGRLLQGVTRLMAIGTFAVAYPLIRYSAEAKPYGSDMFVSLVLLTLAVEWCRQPSNRRLWWALTLTLPLALTLSYPAVFVAGGIAATMATVLWRRGSLRDWLLWGTTCAAIGVGFAAVYLGSAQAQMAKSGEVQQNAFAAAFPPLDSVKKFALFAVASNTSESMAYPIGGDHGASVLTTLSCLTALVILLRGRRFSLALLCAAPLALNFLAAVLHRYPYGNHARFALFMAPIFCLLTGLGTAAFLSLLKNRGWSAAGPVKAAIAVLVLIAVVTTVRDFLKPYKEPCWGRNRDFARWFWCDKAQDAELACYVNDMHGKKVDSDLASIYYCNQRIYSARLAKRKPLQLDQVSKNHPLRVVRFHASTDSEADEAEFGHWLKSQEAKYGFVRRENFPMTFWVKRKLICVDQVELYEFVPVEDHVASK